MKILTLYVVFKSGGNIEKALPSEEGYVFSSNPIEHYSEKVGGIAENARNIGYAAIFFGFEHRWVEYISDTEQEFGWRISISDTIIHNIPAYKLELCFTDTECEQLCQSVSDNLMNPRRIYEACYSVVEKKGWFAPLCDFVLSSYGV